MKISLCLMVWNELQGCQIDVPNIARDHFHEIFAVDGGSTDGTKEYLEAQKIPVYKQPTKGLNAAYIHANNIASGDYVVVFFPKGTTPTGDVLKIAPLFQQGYELVIASRQIRGSVNEEDTELFRPRKWLVWCMGLLACILWRREGNWVRDVLHGFKGWKKSAFDKMNILNFGLSIDIEMVARSYKLRISRVEFPTQEISRSYGVTHFKIWPTGKRLVAYVWYELFRKMEQ
jgi:glycosyltransferase involved in cell wall biosynthesis